MERCLPVGLYLINIKRFGLWTRRPQICLVDLIRLLVPILWLLPSHLLLLLLLAEIFLFYVIFPLTLMLHLINISSFLRSFLIILLFQIRILLQAILWRIKRDLRLYKIIRYNSGKNQVANCGLPAIWLWSLHGGDIWGLPLLLVFKSLLGWYTSVVVTVFLLVLFMFTGVVL